jgi:hypothetical protein
MDIKRAFAIHDCSNEAIVVRLPKEKTDGPT